MPLKRRAGSPHWWYDFTVHGYRYRGSTKTDDREAAEIIAAKLESDTRIDRAIGRKPRLTLGEATRRYWDEHAKRLPSADTIEYQLANLKAGVGAATFLDAIEVGALAVFAASRRGRVSDSSVNREFTILRAVLRMAGRRWGMAVPEIDWPALRLREPEPRKRYLTEQEADKLLAAAAPHLRAPIILSITTGLRLNNIARLDWSQVDLQRREITVRQKSKRPGGETLVVPLNEEAFLALANANPKDTGPVWYYRGRPTHSWKRAFSRAVTRAGLSGLRWHDLRHTTASWLIQGGQGLDLVRDVLGHSEVATTQRYAHRDTSAKRRAVDQISGRFGHIARKYLMQPTGEKKKVS